jgi:hypothetical protein
MRPLVPGEPSVERLQPGIQSSREIETARGAEHGLEVALELEHVPKILCAGETEAAGTSGGTPL